jgi:hypothetical protein
MMFGKGGGGDVHHHGILSGIGAGAMAVLFLFGVLLLAWHRVAGQVSTGITVLVDVLVVAACVLPFLMLFYAVIWLRHRVRNPELLARQPVLRAEAVPVSQPQPGLAWKARPVSSETVAAIEPPPLADHPTEALVAELMRRKDEA